MRNTFPPGGSRHQDQRGQAPRLSSGDFPTAVVWTVEYRDRVARHGMNIVLSQAALEGLMRLLREEEQAAQAVYSFKLVKSPELASTPRAVRVCDVIGHNHKDRPQYLFCHECGKKTRIASIVEDE